jgi:hypothetical protein
VECIPQESLVLKDISKIFTVEMHIFVSFVDYLAGRKLGLYWPSLPPTYQRKNNDKKIDYTNIMKEELLRQCIRQKMGMS